VVSDLPTTVPLITADPPDDPDGPDGPVGDPPPVPLHADAPNANEATTRISMSDRIMNA